MGQWPVSLSRVESLSPGLPKGFAPLTRIFLETLPFHSVSSPLLPRGAALLFSPRQDPVLTASLEARGGSGALAEHRSL